MINLELCLENFSNLTKKLSRDIIAPRRYADEYDQAIKNINEVENTCNIDLTPCLQYFRAFRIAGTLEKNRSAPLNAQFHLFEHCLINQLSKNLRFKDTIKRKRKHRKLNPRDSLI